MTSSVTLPGEIVPAQHANLKLGPGLLQSVSGPSGSTTILSTRAGELKHSANRSKWWIESNARRVSSFWFISCRVYNCRLFQYIPAAQESVLGQIISRAGEGYRVDIGAAHPASLDGLAFEGATKRNRPNLKVRIRFRNLFAFSTIGSR